MKQPDRSVETEEVEDVGAVDQEEFPRPIRLLAVLMTAVSGALMLVIIGLTSLDIVQRKLGTQGVSGTVDITEVLLVVIAAAGLVVAEVDDMHVRSPIVTDRVGPTIARVMVLLGLLVAVATTLWLAYEALHFGLDSFERREYRFGLAQTPVWPAKLFIPAAVAAFLVALVARTWIAVRRIRESLRAEDGELGHAAPTEVGVR